jgi:hypothetical protein
MVKKSKKPKYCENSNMFSDFECNPNVSLILFVPIKKHKTTNQFYKKELSLFFNSEFETFPLYTQSFILKIKIKVSLSIRAKNVNKQIIFSK